LKEKSFQLEEYSIFRERDRIAGEMHDTVGHTLTTALIENEAAKFLIFNNPQEAYTKIALAGEQMRKSINELRSSVKKIKEGENLVDFFTSLQNLKKDLEYHSGISINMNIEKISNLHTIQEKVLYKVILESITNGIKHGKATSFNVKFKKVHDNILLEINDNGIGNDNFSIGFGLTVMEDRIKGIGGRIKFESSINTGFCVYVEIPIGK